MKKITFLFSLFLLSSLTSFGQVEYLDVKPSYGEGDVNPTLDQVIAKDNNRTNRVYRLERNGLYVMTDIINADYSLAIVAAEGTGTPPTIMRGISAEGADIDIPFNLNGNDNKYYFENIIFNGVDFDKSYDTEYRQAVVISGSNVRAEFQGCVFNAWQASAVELTGENNIVYMSDNTWRNGSNTQFAFTGQQASFGKLAIDSLVMTNNTFVNNQSYFLLTGGQGLADYVLFEHNTVFTTMIDAIHTPDMINAHFNSNIFYGYGAYGDTQKSISGGWYTDDDTNMSTMRFRKVAGTQLTDHTPRLREKDRVIEVNNNVNFTPQEIKDFHSDKGVTTAAWMNDVTTAMFNDDTNYPKFTESNNLLGKDPKFKNTNVLPWVLTELVKACIEGHAASNDLGTFSNRRNMDEQFGSDPDQSMFILDWPLVEGNMEVTDAALLTGGHDGLPIGNLNWKSTNRKSYNYPVKEDGKTMRMFRLVMFGAPLSTDDVDFNNMGYKLSSYPNPATSSTTIAFKLPQNANVTISVYDIMGQKIATVANGTYKQGEHSVVWNASNVASGLYIYKLETENVSQAYQLVITK